MAVQLIVAAGASVAGAAGVHERAERPAIGSLMVTLWSVTLPEFVPVNV